MSSEFCLRSVRFFGTMLTVFCVSSLVWNSHELFCSRGDVCILWSGSYWSSNAAVFVVEGSHHQTSASEIFCTFSIFSLSFPFLFCQDREDYVTSESNV